MCSPRHEARMNGNIGSIHQDVGGGRVEAGRNHSSPAVLVNVCGVCTQCAYKQRELYKHSVQTSALCLAEKKNIYSRYRIKYTH